MAADWVIYGNGLGGWYAWNAKRHKASPLVLLGSFDQAVKAFERKFGDYYGSR